MPDASLGAKQHDQEPAAFKAYAKPQSAPQTFFGRWWKIWLVGGDVILIGEQGAQTSVLRSTSSSQSQAHMPPSRNNSRPALSKRCAAVGEIAHSIRTPQLA